MRRTTALLLALALTGAACGGDDGTDAEASDDGGARALEATVREEGGPIAMTSAACRFDGDRQMLAEGIVRNAGEKAYHVSISVRFVDADGVRVEIASDSVSDLESRESARWDASAYSDSADDARRCEVSVSAS